VENEGFKKEGNKDRRHEEMKRNAISRTDKRERKGDANKK
jgi:hypothetical protein